MPKYPLVDHEAHLVRSPRGLSLHDITLDAVMRGDATMEDLRISSTALDSQADIAEQAGRRQLAENLRRAAELVNVPDALILEIYNALRPGRSTAEELARLADTLDREYAATRCAALVREAASLPK